MPPPVHWRFQLVLSWPWTVTFWSQNVTHSSLYHNTSLLQVLWKSDYYFSRYRANKPRKCCFKHTLFHRDLELWPFHPKLWSVHLCPITHRWCKFGESVSNTQQHIVLTLFWDAHGRTDEQDKKLQYASGHTTFGGGIKRREEEMLKQPLWFGL